MKLTTKGRYAVMAMADLALFKDKGPISVRGAKGGYVLESSPEIIKISNIIAAVDEEVKMLNCKKDSKKGCNNKSTKCITHNLWDQLDQHINNFFDKVKLQDLVIKKQTLNK
jgi:Rrf2 family iron-sulfur cluster assembly transcriptional regulator